MNEIDLAIKNYSEGKLKLDNIPAELWKNKDFVIKICNISQKATSFFCDEYYELFNNKEIILNIFEKNRACFSYLNSELREDVDFWIDLMKINSSLDLIFAHENVQQDMTIGLLSQQSSNFRYLNPILKNDLTFISKYIVNNPNIVVHLSSDILNNKEAMLSLFHINPYAINTFVRLESDSLYDKDFVQEIISLSPDAILYLPEIHYTKELLLKFREYIEPETDLNINLILNQYIREEELLATLNNPSVKKPSKRKSKI